MRKPLWAALFALPLLAGTAGRASAFGIANPSCCHGFSFGCKCLNLFPGIHQHGPLYNYGPYTGEGYAWMGVYPWCGSYTPAYPPSAWSGIPGNPYGGGAYAPTAGNPTGYTGYAGYPAASGYAGYPQASGGYAGYPASNYSGYAGYPTQPNTASPASYFYGSQYPAYFTPTGQNYSGQNYRR